MRILITGHKGFIGKNLVRYIRNTTDWELTTYDWGDEFPGIIDQDWVIHLGAISNTTERDLDKVMNRNYEFTKNLFDNCKRFGVNLQYSSSASLYGLGSTFTEDSMLDPRTPYAWSKYLCERHHRLHQGGNIVQAFRYFNVYGNEESHKGGQASPITQFRNQNPIKLFENSDRYLRDFIAVEDVCRIHVEFIKVRESGVWNVGTGKTTSFQTIAELISAKTKAPITYVEMPKILAHSYQSYTCSDNTKLEKTLGPQQWITVSQWLDQHFS